MFLNALWGGGLQVKYLQLLHQSHVINNYKTSDFLIVQIVYQTVLQILILIKYIYLSSVILIINCMSMYVQLYKQCLKGLGRPARLISFSPLRCGLVGYRVSVRRSFKYQLCIMCTYIVIKVLPVSSIPLGSKGILPCSYVPVTLLVSYHMGNLGRYQNYYQNTISYNESVHS